MGSPSEVAAKAPKKKHTSGNGDKGKHRKGGRTVEKRNGGSMDEDDSTVSSSPNSAEYQDVLGRSRTSSYESVKSNLSLDSYRAESAMSTPVSEYLAFQQPFKSVSFSCGGWLQFYLFGVARAFQAMGIHKDVQWAGCSAGALAAAGIALDGDFDAAIDFCKRKCLPRTNSVSGLFTLDEYVGTCIDLLLIQAGKYRQLEPGELQVAVTKFPYLSTVRVTEHLSAEDLKETLLCSAAAYPAAPIFNHKRFGLCIDGGLSDFQPVIDADTITVSPFYFSDCDIRPSRYVPPWWAFIPPRDGETVDWIYNLGFEDGMAWIEGRKVGRSPHAIKKLRKPIDRNTGHEFDTPRQVSVHRFLGYNPKKATAGYALAFLCDLVLLLLFLGLLRPVFLILIYTELVLNSVSKAGEVVVGELLAPLGYLGNTFLLLFEVKINHSKAFAKPAAVVSLEMTGNRLLGIKARGARRQDFVETCSCLMSLSLLLRFFSGFNRASNKELRKHDKLYKHSILYRVLRHAV